MKTSLFFSGVTVATPAPPPLPEKTIFWCDQDGGAQRFPSDRQAIFDRMHASEQTPLQAFVKAVSQAQERIWVVDEYLFAPAEGKKPMVKLGQILDWFKPGLAASDIRMLTKTHEEIDTEMLTLFEVLGDEISLEPRRPTRCVIEVRTHLTKSHNYLHDRFAIIDDELWHFGGSVGGFHHTVSAASRGWSALEHGAIEFFKMIWDPRTGK